MRRIAREWWPERKAIQVKWLEALVSLFSFRRAVSAGIESVPKRRAARIALSLSWK